ncbi:MAG: phage tail fiber protein [Metamycoplasmataceae bacterium]
MSANTRAPSTIVTITLTGQTEFTIPFEYLARKYVEVTLLGIDRLPLVLNVDYRFVNKTLISLTRTYGAEYKQIELRRVTSATERLVDFHDGSILRAYDLNLSQIQTLHVAEEARDLAADLLGVNDEGNLDARGKRIVNVAYAQNGGDAVPLGQLVGMENGSYQSALKAEYYAGVAQDAADGIGENLTVTARGSTTPRLLPDHLGTVTNALNFGLSTSATSAENLAAISKAALLGVPVYVPRGDYRVTNPRDLPNTLQLYGQGRLIFDNAEWWRKGGSSGSVDVPEKYTLFYNFTSRNDVSVTFDNVAQALDWVDDRTVKTVGPPSTAAVRINILGGWLTLTDTPMMLASFNMIAGSVPEQLNPTLPEPTTNPRGFNNVGFGPSTLLTLESGGNNTAFGSRVLTSVKSGENNTAMGFQAAYRVVGTGNTAVGSIALEHLTTGNQNTAIGLAAAGQLIDGTGNVALGFDALGEAVSTKYSVNLGYRAQGNTGPTSSENGVYIGAFAGDFCLSSQNVAIGYRALNCEGRVASAQNHATENTAIGAFTLRKLNSGSQNVVAGAGALSSAISANRSVVLGFEACSTTIALGSYNVVLGWKGGQSVTGDGNILIGNSTAAKMTSGSSNIGIGSGSLATNVSGGLNTAVGVNAGRLTSSGQDTVDLTNTTALGNDARVSASNQVQLGNSATTTYVYGTVQNRSDARDKVDVRDTSLGLDFISKLRPVEGRWDLREDYVECVDVVDVVTKLEPIYDETTKAITGMREVEVENVSTETIQLPKDGSKARTRFHQWFLAQDVKKVMDEMGVDFGGFQDHSVSGGSDVMTLGYDEFIPPLVKAVQELTELVKEQRIEIEKLKGVQH